MWDPKYGVAYCVVHVMGRQLELADKGGKVYKVNVQDIKITNLVDELIGYLPYETAFEYATKYWTHSKLMED